mmetsp:Transcript_55019/g.66253  ORF Transcript_55019/g.66253 Transcript_55019/m.66253 type:complete len:96 (+) Transcript_55019:56-343(+)
MNRSRLTQDPDPKPGTRSAANNIMLFTRVTRTVDESPKTGDSLSSVGGTRPKKDAVGRRRRVQNGIGTFRCQEGNDCGYGRSFEGLLAATTDRDR